MLVNSDLRVPSSFLPLFIVALALLTPIAAHADQDGVPPPPNVPQPEFSAHDGLTFSGLQPLFKAVTNGDAQAAAKILSQLPNCDSVGGRVKLLVLLSKAYEAGGQIEKAEKALGNALQAANASPNKLIYLWVQAKTLYFMSRRGNFSQCAALAAKMLDEKEVIGNENLRAFFSCCLARNLVLAKSDQEGIHVLQKLTVTTQANRWWVATEAEYIGTVAAAQGNTAEWYVQEAWIAGTFPEYAQQLRVIQNYAHAAELAGELREALRLSLLAAERAESEADIENMLTKSADLAGQIGASREQVVFYDQILDLAHGSQDPIYKAARENRESVLRHLGSMPVENKE